MPHDHLIIFTRYPEPGRTKTRLIPVLGRDGAARLQRQLTERLLARLTAAGDGGPGITIRYTGASSGQMAQWLGSGITCRPQEEGDLGRRMLAALTSARTEGGGRILLAGSDCPDLGPGLIRAAYELLRSNDLVIGPSEDGGYYLIGMAADIAPAALAPLFTDMAWGTATVLAETMARARLLGLRCGLLPTLHDIDRPEDLAHLHHHPGPE